MNEILLVAVVLGIGGFLAVRLLRAKRSRPAARTAGKTTAREEDERDLGTMGIGTVGAAFIIGGSLAGPEGDRHLAGPEGGGYEGGGHGGHDSSGSFGGGGDLGGGGGGGD